MSWLSKATGINIDLSKPLKKVANDALNEAKKPVIAMLVQAKIDLSVKATASFTDANIRSFLHDALNGLKGVPMYLMIPVSIAIDTFSFTNASKSASTISGQISVEIDRIIEQVKGARL